MGCACRSWWLPLVTQLAIRPVRNNNIAKSLLFLTSIMRQSLYDTHHLMSDWYHSRPETIPEEQAGGWNIIAARREWNIEAAASERYHWLVRPWQLKIMVDL